MKNENVRQSLLLVLAIVSIILVLSEPSSESNWFVILLTTKAIGFGFGYLCYHLYQKWYVQD